VDGSTQIPKEAVLLMKTSVMTEASLGRQTWPKPTGTRLIADNNQMVWDITEEGRGVVTIFSESSRGVIGYGGGKKFALRDITVEPGDTVQNGWSTITVNSFGKSFLVTATGLAENTGMVWKNAEKSSVGRDWGSAPSMVEGVSAKITFGNVPQRAKVIAYALDERGARREPVQVERPGNGVILNIGPKWKTIWYEVEVQ
jgi:hypothetical protein